jgi:hypothetical protein
MSRRPKIPLLASVAKSALCRCGHTAAEHGEFLPAPCLDGKHEHGEALAAACNRFAEGKSLPGDAELMTGPIPGCKCIGFSPAETTGARQ